MNIVLSYLRRYRQDRPTLAVAASPDLPAVGHAEDVAGPEPIPGGGRRDPSTPYPSIRLDFDEKDLASEESLWDLYERWQSHYDVVTTGDLDEKRRRFDIFKDEVRFIHEHNSKDLPYKLGLNFYSDRTSPPLCFFQPDDDGRGLPPLQLTCDYGSLSKYHRIALASYELYHLFGIGWNREKVALKNIFETMNPELTFHEATTIFVLEDLIDGGDIFTYDVVIVHLAELFTMKSVRRSGRIRISNIDSSSSDDLSSWLLPYSYTIKSIFLSKEVLSFSEKGLSPKEEAH